MHQGCETAPFFISVRKKVWEYKAESLALGEERRRVWRFIPVAGSEIPFCGGEYGESAALGEERRRAWGVQL